MRHIACPHCPTTLPSHARLDTHLRFECAGLGRQETADQAFWRKLWATRESVQRSSKRSIGVYDD